MSVDAGGVKGRGWLLAALFVLSFGATGYAESAQVRATARILVTKYTVGDNVRVLIETETPKGTTIEPPSEKSDLSPFELKKIETAPVARGKNRVRRTFILNVTAFEKGDLKFPSVALRWRAPDGRQGEVRTEPVTVTFASVGRRPSDKDDIRPIKSPASFGTRWFWNALAGALAGLLAAGLAGRLLWRRLRAKPEDESAKPPHVRAGLELERLKDRDLVGSGQAREYLAGLADILRRYIERRFNVEAMEKTTAELSESMKSRGFDRTVIERSRVFLERADAVKFARQEPSRAEWTAAEKELLAFVDETTPKTQPGKGAQP